MLKKSAVLALVSLATVVSVLAFTLTAQDAKPKSDAVNSGAKAAKAEKVTVTGGAKAEQVTMMGRLTCTSCVLAHPDKPCTKECCISCWKSGDPPLLTVADGNMYILLSGEQKVPLMTPARAELAGGQVTVKGLLVKGKGIQVIYVDAMEKAAEPKAKDKAAEVKS